MPTDGPRRPRPGDRSGRSRNQPPRPRKATRKSAKKRAAKKGRPPRRDGGRVVDDAGLAGPKQWGRVARRGAGGMDRPDPGEPSRTDRRPGRTPSGPSRTPPPGRSVPTADDLRRTAAGAVDRARGPAARERRPLGARPQRPVDPAATLTRVVGPPRDARLLKRLEDAGRAFEAERFGDARALLAPVVKAAPELPEGRELLGLTLYRLGRWADAIEELETFRELTASTEQHPVLADCHRALGRWSDVDELWAELGEASPAPELVTEGRIVAAGAKADQGDVAGAIRMLEKGWRLPKRPRPDHLRRAYALADLYDRAGRTPRARELFGWIARHDPDLADVKARLRALS